jgi:hypothetical protein
LPGYPDPPGLGPGAGIREVADRLPPCAQQARPGGGKTRRSGRGVLASSVPQSDRVGRVGTKRSRRRRTRNDPPSVGWGHAPQHTLEERGRRVSDQVAESGRVASGVPKKENGSRRRTACIGNPLTGRAAWIPSLSARTSRFSAAGPCPGRRDQIQLRSNVRTRGDRNYSASQSVSRSRGDGAVGRWHDQKWRCWPCAGFRCKRPEQRPFLNRSWPPEERVRQ